MRLSNRSTVCYKCKTNALPQHGCAWTCDAVWKSATSAALLEVNPDKTFPPALLNLGISCPATVLGSSPAFNRFSRVDDFNVAHPRLNENDVSAPTWLSVSVTELLTALLTHETNCWTSFWRSWEAVDCDKGKENPTLQDLDVHLWPNPTVGRPIGSGAGDATKPSNFFMRLIVASLGDGPPLQVSELVEADGVEALAVVLEAMAVALEEMTEELVSVVFVGESSLDVEFPDKLVSLSVEFPERLESVSVEFPEKVESVSVELSAMPWEESKGEVELSALGSERSGVEDELPKSP